MVRCLTQFRFRSRDGQDIAPGQWLLEWEQLYPVDDYPGYAELIAKHKSFSAADFERIGQWKDRGANGKQVEAECRHGRVQDLDGGGFRAARNRD